MSNVFPGQLNLWGDNIRNDITEVTTMNAMQEELFWELRKTQLEIVRSLRNKQKNEWIVTVLEDELEDITTAIQKLEEGNFGQCETSGEPIPEYLLKIMPTIKNSRDSEILEHFYRKPINSSIF
jgi:RNA polymerase-binding transcription factor DksA